MSTHRVVVTFDAPRSLEDVWVALDDPASSWETPDLKVIPAQGSAPDIWVRHEARLPIPAEGVTLTALPVRSMPWDLIEWRVSGPFDAAVVWELAGGPHLTSIRSTWSVTGWHWRERALVTQVATAVAHRVAGNVPVHATV